MMVTTTWKMSLDIRSGVGRSHITGQMVDKEEEEVCGVMEPAMAAEVEVQEAAGRWHRMIRCSNRLSPAICTRNAQSRR